MDNFLLPTDFSFEKTTHLPKSVVHIRNGGIEQAFLEIANEDGLLSDKDLERLNYLKLLPQNRMEDTQ